MRKQPLGFIVALTLTTALLATSFSLAGGAGPAFKAAIPGDSVKELVAREAKIIEELAGGNLDEEGRNRIRMGGAIIAALVVSCKDGDSADAREAGVKIAGLAGKKGSEAEIKKLAAGLKSITLAKGKGDMDLSKLGLDKASLMDHFRTKNKSGDGIHPVLQSSIPLKGALNGVEEKIRALAKKKMLPANLDKESAELALLGYRSAAVGSLTYVYTPAKKGKQDPAIWRESALHTRDAGLELAEAALKKDLDGVFKASNTLNNACSRCHIDYRN